MATTHDRRGIHSSRGDAFWEEWEKRHDRDTDILIRELERRKKMHARNGRVLQNGDVLVSLTMDGRPISVGTLFGAVPGNDYCNGKLAAVETMPITACLCDCLHVDDLAAILKEKGLDKRPAGK
jgi:hypothetical protein